MHSIVDVDVRSRTLYLHPVRRGERVDEAELAPGAKAVVVTPLPRRLLEKRGTAVHEYEFEIELQAESYTPLKPVYDGRSRAVETLKTLVDERFDTLLGIHDGRAPSFFHSVLQYCKRHGLWLHNTKNIRDGFVLFCTTDDERRLPVVVKLQSVPAPDACFDTTPGPCATELRALVALAVMMRERSVAPVFCELWGREVAHVAQARMLSTSMCGYACDLAAWIRGSGSSEVTHRRCTHQPNFTCGADPFAAWVYSACAGHALITSKYATDRKLFNLIMRATIFHVLLGLAQAQRHCLFTHNDMHAGNVLFDTRSLKKARMLLTGAGAFLIPPTVPSVRIIDFQHAAFDVYDSNGAQTGRTSGYKADVFNAFSLSYDSWRFCSFVTLELLRPYWRLVDADVRGFLWRACAFAGDSTDVLPPTIATEVHWAPYLVDAPTPEELLRDGVFDCFRCDARTPAHVFDDEASPPSAAQDRYARTVLLRNGRSAPDEARRAASLRFRVPDGCLPVRHRFPDRPGASTDGLCRAGRFRAP